VVPERYTSSLAREEKQETGLKQIIGLPEYKIEIPSDKNDKVSRFDKSRK
jgi:hypothetical protein